MDSDKTITAHFSEIVEYTLTALVNPLEGGSVTLSPSGGVYDEGTVVTITAVANTGYELNHWSGDASGNDSAIQITMDNNKSITAHFVATNYRPTVSITFPLNGTEVKKTVTIQGTASDEDGNETIQKVEIKIGDEDWTVVNGTTSWNFSWDTTSVDNGDYIIQARSYDGYEHSSIDSVTMEVKNKEKDDGIPGFEMLVLIIAVGLIAIMRRKKQ